MAAVYGSDLDGPPASSIKSLRGNPVYWKDTVRLRFGTRGIIIAAVVMGLLLLSYLAVVAPRSNYSRVFPTDLHMVYLFCLGLLGGLVAIVMSASGIPAEREARTWDMLLASPLTNGQIVWGKFLATLRRFRLAYVPLAIHVVIFTLSGSLHPIAIVFVAAVVVGSAVFIAAVGVLVGTYIRRTTASLVTMLLLFAVLWFGGPLLAMMVENRMTDRPYLRDRVSMSLWNANPLVQLIVIGNGTTERVRYSSGYGYDRETYDWPTGSASQDTTALRILLTTAGYVGFGAIALLIARDRVRKVKE